MKPRRFDSRDLHRRQLMDRTLRHAFPAHKVTHESFAEGARIGRTAPDRMADNVPYGIRKIWICWDRLGWETGGEGVRHSAIRPNSRLFADVRYSNAFQTPSSVVDHRR